MLLLALKKGSNEKTTAVSFSPLKQKVVPRKSSLSQMITQSSRASGLYSTSMHLNKCYESGTAFHLHTLKDSSKRDLRKRLSLLL